MAIVLHLIALAMVAIGAAAISFGSGIVALERGWTMVISGSVSVAGGCVLLGIATASARLGTIVAELRHLRESLAAVETGDRLVMREDAPSGLEPPPILEAPERASLPEARLDGPPSAKRILADAPLPPRAPGPVVGLDPAPEPALEAGREPTPEPRVASAAPDLTAVPVMDPPPPREPSVFESLNAGERSIIASPAEQPAKRRFWKRRDEPSDGVVSEDEANRSSPASSAEDAEATASFPEGADIKEPPPPSLDEAFAPRAAGAADGDDAVQNVVGSYSSGDNSYVMFSDGSIQAHTPMGQYKFTSLDDLKRFLATEPETASSSGG